MSRAVELNLLERGKIGIQNTLHTVYLRIENITVQRKAMRSTSHIWAIWNLPAKSVHRVHLICIIVLKNAHYSRYGSCIIILIILRIQIVKRVWIVCWPIRHGIINSNMDANLASTENIVQE